MEGVKLKVKVCRAAHFTEHPDAHDSQKRCWLRTNPTGIIILPGLPISMVYSHETQCGIFNVHQQKFSRRDIQLNAPLKDSTLE